MKAASDDMSRDVVLVFSDGTRDGGYRVEGPGVLGESEPDGTWTRREVRRVFSRTDGMWWRFVEPSPELDYERLPFKVETWATEGA